MARPTVSPRLDDRSRDDRMTKGQGQMDSYSAEMFAEARRQRIIDEADRRRLLRSGAAETVPSRRWSASWPFAIARRLAHVTQAS